MDGIEEGIDKWLEGLWPALKAAVAPEGAKAAATDAAAAPAAAGGAEGELAGVPPLPRCRVRLVWKEGSAAGAAGAEGAAPVPPQLEFCTPTAAELAYRDAEGHYSAEQPFWAPVTEARWLTTDKSDADRQASAGLGCGGAACKLGLAAALARLRRTGASLYGRPRWLAGSSKAGCLCSSFKRWLPPHCLQVAACGAARGWQRHGLQPCLPASEFSYRPCCSLQVLHVELDVAGSGMAFAPGDAIGVLPQNDASLVAALLERLGLDGEAVFDVQPADEAAAAAGGDAGAGDASGAAGSAQHHSERLLPHLRAPCSVRAALTAGVDLTGPPRKSQLRLLGEHCADPGERRRLLHLCSRDGRDAYAADIMAARPSLLDLLKQFPSCRPPLDALLDALPPLAARMYSLTNSPLATPDRVSCFR